MIQGDWGNDIRYTEGYIIEVGYNMAGTAKRENSRFIAVTLAGSSSKTASGTTLRTKDVTNLLDWAFENFATASLDPGPLPSPRAWFGASRRLVLEPASANAITVARAEVAGLKIEVSAPVSVRAPVAKGTVVGKLTYLLDGKELQSINLVAARRARRKYFMLLFDVTRLMTELLQHCGGISVSLCGCFADQFYTFASVLADAFTQQET